MRLAELLLQALSLLQFLVYQMSHVMRKPIFRSVGGGAGFRPGKTQTGLLSCRDQLESRNFGFSKYRYSAIKAADDKGADQTARMRRLICTFVVRIWHKAGFLMTWLK